MSSSLSTHLVISHPLTLFDLSFMHACFMGVILVCLFAHMSFPSSQCRQGSGSGVIHISVLSSVMYHMIHVKYFLALHAFSLCILVFFLLRPLQSLHHAIGLYFSLLTCKSFRIRALQCFQGNSWVISLYQRSDIIFQFSIINLNS